METLGPKMLFHIARLALLLLFVVGATAQSPTSPEPAAAPPAQPPQSQAATSQPTATQPAASGAPVEPAPKPADQPASSDEPVTTIRATTNEVNVVFTVTDKHGKRITDLKLNDFHIVDDNKPPEEIRSFHAETNLPL